MPVHVALLRGINVGGGNKIPMAELRALAAELGWERPETYIQSGNLVFDAVGDAAALEAALEEAIKKRFGLTIPIVVRSNTEWSRFPSANPFPRAAEEEPNRLMLISSKLPPQPGSAVAIQEKCRDGERVAEAAGVLWVHYPAGAGTSRLTPATIDKLIGSPATARNWRTVLKLQEMLAR